MPPERRLAPNSTILQKGQENYPTPTVQNKLVVEYVSLEVGAYELLEYGALWESTSHTAFAASYDGYILVAQQPAFDNNSWFMRRVWAAPWVGQSDWNYSFTYLEQDPDYPIVTRVETVLRETYTPSPPLTPDVDYPGALLTEERLLNQTEPQDMNSKFVQVVKVFTTLPGPIVSTQDFDTTLNALVFTERQTVLSTDEFDPSLEPLTLAMSESPISKFSKLRITSFLEELPAPFTETSTGRFNFPVLVPGIELDVLQWTLDPDRSEVRWYFSSGYRSQPNVPAIFQTETEYFTSPPALPTIFAIPTQDLIYNGTSFNISVGNVLNDLITVDATFIDDSKYGNLDESKTFLATALTATAYSALIGTYKIVAADIKRYRGAIYIRQSTSVLLL